MRNAAKVNIKRSFKGGVPLEARKSDQSAGERRSAVPYCFLSLIRSMTAEIFLLNRALPKTLPLIL